MRAFELATSVPWAITSEALGTILRIAERESLDPEAVAARLGRPLDNARQATVRDGVAVIPIDGPIFRHANLFTEISGATSTEQLALDLQAAVDDPGVASILLSIDSPGGEVSGTHELAGMIRAIRGVKPIKAYVSHLGASAAYWLASAADEVIADATASLGSIGVVATMSDPQARGKGNIVFVSSQSPWKRPDPTSEGGRSRIQAQVDALADVFIADVAANRGTDAETVAANYGGGDVLVGQYAVAAGLADRLGSFEGVLAELASAPETSRRLRVVPQSPRRAARVAAGELVERVAAFASADLTPSFASWQETAEKSLAAAAAAPVVVTQEGVPMSGEIITGTLEVQADGTREELAELRAKFEASEQARVATEAQREALAEQVASMAKDARRKRFTDEVTGASNDGMRWFGSVEEHVDMLEALTEAFGSEGHERVQKYIQQQRATAQMVRSSDVFKEQGNDGKDATSSAAARVTALAEEYRASHPGATIQQAKAAVMEREPTLARDYQNESRGK